MAARVRPTYRAAMEWIAWNDNPGDDDLPIALSGYISVCLVADMWGKSSLRVATDVFNIRGEDSVVGQYMSPNTEQEAISIAERCEETCEDCGRNQKQYVDDNRCSWCQDDRDEEQAKSLSPYTDQEAYDHENPAPLENPMDWEN